MAVEPWTIRKVLTWATDDLRAKGIESPRLEVEVMLAAALGSNRIQLILDADKPLSSKELADYKASHQRRRNYEPVAYIIGRREFYGREFLVDQRVLIPRPDTETLVDVVLRRAPPGGAAAVDLCTGSGCVGVTLSLERPAWTMTLTDVDAGALEVARTNATALGAASIEIVAGDLLDAVAGRRFDVITANPPYIPANQIAGLAPDIRDHEPKLALDGGEEGLFLIQKLVAQAPAFLEAAGLLAMELESSQGESAKGLFERAGFQDIEISKDLGGRDRVVSGLLPS